MNQIEGYRTPPLILRPPRACSWVNEIDGYTASLVRYNPDPHMRLAGVFGIRLKDYHATALSILVLGSELASWVNEIDSYTAMLETHPPLPLSWVNQIEG